MLQPTKSWQRHVQPGVSLEDCQREYDGVTRSAPPQRSRYTQPSSFSTSCTVQTPVFHIWSRSGYLSGFTNAAVSPSSASNGKPTCQTKKSPREPACPAESPSCFRCSCAGLATSQGCETYACPGQSSSASSKKKNANRGAPRKHYKDQLKRQAAQAGISHQSWQQEALDRDS